MIKSKPVFYQSPTALKALFKYQLFIVATLALGCSEHKAPDFQQSELAPGGTMTVKRLQRQSYIHPGAAVTGMQKLNFWTGFSFFRDPWVASPSSTKSRDGLGPLFNTRSCISCHDAGSRGPMSEVGESMPSALVIKLGLRDKFRNMGDHTPALAQGLSLVDPNYGDQIQPRGILFRHPKLAHAPQGEALLNLSYQAVSGHYSDGTAYELSQPKYQLTEMAYGDLAAHIGITPRFAPNIFGAGLLDAIHVDDLLAQEDINDNNQDGISAKYNRALNIATGTVDIGRFSLKAKHPTLAQQVAAAFRNDIGITSRLFPTESCTEPQIICQQTAILGEPSINTSDQQAPVEISDKLFNLVVSFNQLLGVPPARNLTQEKVLKGREHFYQIGCQQCHTPSYRTDKNYPVEVLADQLIWPYTDLALHDMGERLADNVIEDDANGQEWRTPPLWGIGLQKSTTKQQRFLHDGRANSISEAILWHGGEAEVAQKKFTQLTSSQRQNLIKFLQSI
jgi:CxxC motif-containing protein (DUF1111 family)